jgi:hypothetical protein
MLAAAAVVICHHSPAYPDSSCLSRSIMMIMCWTPVIDVLRWLVNYCPGGVVYNLLDKWYIKVTAATLDRQLRYTVNWVVSCSSSAANHSVTRQTTTLHCQLGDVLYQQCKKPQ